MPRFTVLGIHGRPDDEQVGTRYKPDVARVRMVLDDYDPPKKVVDEDFDLPTIPLPGVSPTLELYCHMLRPAIEARMAELGKK